MVSYHGFYQVMLLGLLWLLLMLHVVWPSARPAQKQRTTQPILPPHKRSKAPKPFMGLTYKPHCDAGEQGVASRRDRPALRPRLRSRPVAAVATSTPPAISVLIPPVPMAAGVGAAIFARTAIRVVVAGGSSIVAVARATFSIA